MTHEDFIKKYFSWYPFEDDGAKDKIRADLTSLQPSQQGQAMSAGDRKQPKDLMDYLANRTPEQIENDKVWSRISLESTSTQAVQGWATDEDLKEAFEQGYFNGQSNLTRQYGDFHATYKAEVWLEDYKNTKIAIAQQGPVQ